MRVPPSILFRCDGSPEIGLGHVTRCLALAEQFQHRHGCRVSFAMRSGPLGVELVRKRGYPVHHSRSDEYARWLNDVVHRAESEILVLDVRDDLSCEALLELRRKGVSIVTLDDPSERRLLADLAFYPPVPQVRELSWDGFEGRLCVGWEWVILGAPVISRRMRAPETPTVLVAMGGSDPAGLTLKAMRALDSVDAEFETLVVLGPGFRQYEEVQELLGKARRDFSLVKSPAGLASLIAEADLAIASFGVTAYELAAAGVPAVYLCLTEDHARSATTFAEAGIGISLGLHDYVHQTELANTVFTLLMHPSRRWQMSTRAHQLIDGKGAARVADTSLKFTAEAQRAQR